MNVKILKILLLKELTLLRRNPLIPRIIVAMPVLVTLIIPLVATLDVKNVGVAVVDNDHSVLSRRIVADMDASEHLSVTGLFSDYGEALRQVECGNADAIVTIPKGYMKDVDNGKRPQLDLKANGVNATKGTLGSRYAAMSAGNTLARWQSVTSDKSVEYGQASLNFYNSTLDYRNYMIPALMVILVIIICGFLPTLNLVEEKEMGTIEAMNVSPAGRLEFVLSKLIPYWVAGLIVVSVAMLISWLVYGLAPDGNIANIYAATFLFSLIMSGLGVFVANMSSTIMQSVFTVFAFVIVFQLMSGLLTPIASMPEWAQSVTYAIPPRYYIEILRSVYLKGCGIGDLWFQYLALTAFALLSCLLAAMTYKKR